MEGKLSSLASQISGLVTTFIKNEDPCYMMSVVYLPLSVYQYISALNDL